MASLLERFYDPTAGMVMLDGWDLRSLDPSWLRGQVIGFISQVRRQDAFLTAGSAGSVSDPSAQPHSPSSPGPASLSPYGGAWAFPCLPTP